MGLISLFSFGGANGALPQMHHDVVEKYHWLTAAALFVPIAIALKSRAARTSR